MSSMSAASVEPLRAIEGTEKKPLKPCCACPETKKVRDVCIIEKVVVCRCALYGRHAIPGNQPYTVTFPNYLLLQRAGTAM
ncbi:hypothetical protein J4Q44_G00147020 [Coregonus suidteri]|uniref:Uncharacterized protein n=1 Tax=Coregonus suidteri TaxID=861788 RepID=A0AAN8LR34_9TELE